MKTDWTKLIDKYSSREEGTVRIAVLGGGIYGCHIANELASFGANITLYEKEKSLFAGASSWGDTRIHNGVKYLRNKKTQELLKEEQLRFIAKYPHFLTLDIEHENEIQMISEDWRSYLDFGSFVDLYDKSENGKLLLDSNHFEINQKQLECSSSDNDWSKVLNKQEIEKIFPFKHVEGGVLHGSKVCPKMYVDFPGEWFFNQLSQKDNVSLIFKTMVSKDIINSEQQHNVVQLDCLKESDESGFNFKIDNDVFDYVINCTFNQSFPSSVGNNEKDNPYYEVGFSLVFAQKDYNSTTKLFRPFSIYDGPFPGMTPFNIKNIENTIFEGFKGRKLYTSTSGRLGESFYTHDIEDAYKVKKNGNNQSFDRFTNNHWYTLDDDEKDVVNVLSSIQYYYPNLMECFDVIYKFWWIKSLYPSASSARPVMVQSNKEHPNLLSVFSSKVSTVLKAEDLLYEKISELEKL